jgi:hypothetical protein
MSGSINNLLPPPIALGAMAPLDEDRRFIIDATSAMLQAQDTINTIGTVTVTRTDGVAIGTGDVTISNVAVVTVPTTYKTSPFASTTTVEPGYGWVFWATGNGNIPGPVAAGQQGGYLLEFPLTLTEGGGPIVRTAMLPILPNVG